MKREDAIQILNLVKDVINRTRDETILQNWGMIFMIAGTLKLLFCFAANFLLLRTLPIAYFVALGIVYPIILLLTIFALRRRRPGVRTFVEKQVWGIWTTYLVACYFTAISGYLARIPPEHIIPFFGVLASIAWAMMAISISFKLFIFCPFFAVSTIIMYLLPAYQFFILGAGWFLTLELVGLHYFIQKIRYDRTKTEFV